MLLHMKKSNQVKKLDHDRESRKPVIRCGICNGEQVAGLRDLRTGHFEEIMPVIMTATWSSLRRWQDRMISKGNTEEKKSKGIREQMRCS